MNALATIVVPPPIKGKETIQNLFYGTTHIEHFSFFIQYKNFGRLAKLHKLGGIFIG